jgi:hypothetical protein
VIKNFTYRTPAILITLDWIIEGGCMSLPKAFREADEQSNKKEKERQNTLAKTNKDLLERKIAIDKEIKKQKEIVKKYDDHTILKQTHENQLSEYQANFKKEEANLKSASDNERRFLEHGKTQREQINSITQQLHKNENELFRLTSMGGDTTKLEQQIQLQVTDLESLKTKIKKSDDDYKNSIQKIEQAKLALATHKKTIETQGKIVGKNNSYLTSEKTKNSNSSNRKIPLRDN